LKIIKHCKEGIPELVSGQLLGLDVGKTLEITHSFPLLNDADEDGDNTYEVEMMKILRATNVDTQNVGWYQATYLSDFYNTDIIQCHLSYQLEIPNAVTILFDPFQTHKGRLVIKAMRLSNKFMELCAKGNFTAKHFKELGVDPKSIFEELPIKIHNSHLVHAYLYELRETKVADCSAERLNVSAGPIIEKLIDGVSASGGCIDEYSAELDRYKNALFSVNKQRAEYQKRYDGVHEENERRKKIGLATLPYPDNTSVSKLQDPSRLESVVQTIKIDSYCQNIISMSNQAYQKQCVLKALMRGTAEEVVEAPVEISDE